MDERSINSVAWIAMIALISNRFVFPEGDGGQSPHKGDHGSDHPEAASVSGRVALSPPKAPPQVPAEGCPPKIGGAPASSPGPVLNPQSNTRPQSVRAATPFGLRRTDQLFIAVSVVTATLLLAAHWVRLSSWGLEPVEIERFEPEPYTYELDINEASWTEWIQLDRIGPTLAKRIVEDRKQNGPFETIDDLERVKGVGPKTLEQLRPWLRLSKHDHRHPVSNTPEAAE